MFLESFQFWSQSVIRCPLDALLKISEEFFTSANKQYILAGRQKYSGKNVFFSDLGEEREMWAERQLNQVNLVFPSMTDLIKTYNQLTSYVALDKWLSLGFFSYKISSFGFVELKKCIEHNQRHFFHYSFIILNGDRNINLPSGSSGFFLNEQPSHLILKAEIFAKSFHSCWFHIPMCLPDLPCEKIFSPI